MKNSSTLSGKAATWGAAGTVMWAVAVGACYIFSQLLVLYAFVLVKHGDLSTAEYSKHVANLQYSGEVLSVALFASLVVCSGVMWLAIRLKKGAGIMDYLALHTVSGTIMLRWLAILALFLIASDSLTIALERPVVPEFMQKVYLATEQRWLLWPALVIAAPLFEELFFRGFVMTGLSASVLRPVGAVIISAMLWALLHLQYDLYGVMTIFVMGLLLGMARLKTGSVLAPVVLHGIANFVAMLQVSLGLF